VVGHICALLDGVLGRVDLDRVAFADRRVEIPLLLFGITCTR
jgi:hypothetical protein